MKALGCLFPKDRPKDLKNLAADYDRFFFEPSQTRTVASVQSLVALGRGTQKCCYTLRRTLQRVRVYHK